VIYNKSELIKARSNTKDRLNAVVEGREWFHQYCIRYELVRNRIKNVVIGRKEKE